jgi:hypothetical protein
MMEEGLGAPPSSLEDAAAAPPPVKRSEGAGLLKKGTTEKTPESVNYTSAAERCATCEHFDEEALHCNENDFDAEPEGHCDKFELLGDGGGEEYTDQMAGQEMLAEDQGEEAEEEY